MDNDDKIKKQMEFILDQQAQFAADIGRIDAKHEQLQEIVGRLATVTLEGFENLENKMSTLVDGQLRTEDNLSSLTEKTERMAEKITALTDAQAHTDDRLNALINVVERHISEGHDGSAQR